MSDIKSNLVFDFPDPNPRFEFSDASPFAPKKSLTYTKRSTKLKNSRGFGKIKNQKVAGNNGNHGSSNAGFNKSASDGSPDKSTSSTECETTFDESIFDDFDDQVFDFGKSNAQYGASKGSSSAPIPSSPKTKKTNTPEARQATVSPKSNPMSVSRINSNGSTHYEFASGPPSKLTDSPLSHRPLKLPGSSHPSNPHPYRLHQRSPSAYSNISTGYISEVSEFSFDRVTVNTTETPMTGASSNVSWNFLEETKELLGDGKKERGETPFVPYTGESGPGAKKGGGVDVRSTSQDAKKPRNKIDIHMMDNVSLSDRSNDLPISGIVGSNQSIISEISDANVQDDEELNDAVRRHLTTNDADAAAGVKIDNNAPSSPRRPPAPAQSMQCTESSRASRPSRSSDILRDFREYKARRRSESQWEMPRAGNKGGNSAAKKEEEEEKNVFESLMSNLCTGLGFCSFYFCGFDTTQHDGEFRL